ncbi:T9SS C-terminal target domain-containing protein, partial [Candidatus Parcubacteria bacterium]
SEIKLTPSDSQAGDLFGASIALDGDYLLVGAPGADMNVGAAYVFRRTETGWVEEAKLTASDGSSQEDFNDFGWTVALDGDFAVIGAAKTRFLFDIPQEKGAVYVFVRTDTGWVEQEKLTSIDPMPGEFFGYSTSLSGNRLIIGAPGVVGELSKGTAYIFERRGNDWVRTQTLTASDAREQQFLGSSVWFSGDLALVGAPGCCRISGVTYVFKEVNGVWQEQAKLKAGDEQGGNLFGTAIAGSQDVALIGSEGWTSLRGKVYVFQETESGWVQQADLKLDLVPSNDRARFGQTVTLSGDFALIGATHWGPQLAPGEAYLFKRMDTAWEEQLKLTASDGFNGDTFGWSVGLTGQYAVIGAPGYTPPTDNTGAVYIYDLATVVRVREQPSAIPETFSLEQNYPNPFNPTTVIPYRLASGSQVELTVYNALGQRIKTLLRQKQAAGAYQLTWDGTDDRGRKVASGVYLYRLKAGEFVDVKKMILMR